MGAGAVAHALEMSLAVCKLRKVVPQLLGAAAAPKKMGIWGSEMIEEKFPALEQIVRLAKHIS